MLLTSLLFKTILVAVLGFLGNHHADACSVPYIHEKSGNEAKVIKVNSWKDVKLMCKIRFTGHIPKLGYYWLKDNQTLTLSVPQRMRLKPYRYLKIRRVKKEDAGFYTCVVVNDCGKNRYTMQLTVGATRIEEKIKNAPIFTESQYKMRRNLPSVPVGHCVKLDCSADGHPRLAVEWYKDGKLFKERKGGRKLYLNQWTTLLILKDLVPSDAGSYMCNVSNSYGWINHTYEVHVHGPDIREKSRNEAKVIKVNSEKDVKLICQIRSTGKVPKLGYYWLKDNQTLTPSVHQRMKSRLKPYRYLKIRRVKKEDAGFYTCVVVDDCGKNRYTMQLIVGAAAVAPIFTVQYKMRRNRLAVPVGNSVKLDCSADGNPRPTVEWYKDGKLFKERKSGRKLHLSQWTTSLSVMHVVPSDTGSYVCNVSNSYGWINHTYELDVHERARAEPVLLPMENVTVNRGENATFTCKALSDSMPHFQWLRWFPLRSNVSANSSANGSIERPHYQILNKDETDQQVIVTPSNGRKIELHGVKLTLVNVTKKDVGKYTCIVGNAVGYAVEHAYIIVQNIDNAKPTELQKTESITDGFTVSPTTVSSERRSEAVVQTSMSWTDKIQYPAAVIAVSVGVVILLIIAFGLCCWYVKKSQASSSTTMQSQGNIGSLRTTYVAQPNEYVIVPDRKRLYVD